MAELSMHEDLPFDEATRPALVSTGNLPMHAEIQRLVTEAYELYRDDDSGAVADYIPVLAKASPDAVRDRRGRALGPVLRDR